jgi:hypothetical protein
MTRAGYVFKFVTFIFGYFTTNFYYFATKYSDFWLNYLADLFSSWGFSDESIKPRPVNMGEIIIQTAAMAIII